MRLVTTILVSLVAAACSKPASPPAAHPAVPAAPAAHAAPTTCAQGEILGENGCVKECATDEDCGAAGVCEDLHAMNDDGTIGPVQGRGCAK